MEKDEIIESIHTLVSHNVIGDKQLFSRYKGFRSELFLENYLAHKYPILKQLEGGIIISKDSSESSLNNSLYISIIPKDSFLEDYKIIFKNLSKLDFNQMYLILYSENDWNNAPIMHFKDNTISLKVPTIEIFTYNKITTRFETTDNDITAVTNFFDSYQTRQKNKYPITTATKQWFRDNMIPFSKAQLLKIYMNRLILDGYIGFGKQKGKPSDIDMIIKKPDGYFRLIEIKEKDLPKRAQKGFGLDVPRLEDLLRISDITGLEYHLVIREINNQTERELLSWRQIPIEKFATNVDWNSKVEGGTGMRSSESINETLICPLNFFRYL